MNPSKLRNKLISPNWHTLMTISAHYHGFDSSGVSYKTKMTFGKYLRLTIQIKDKKLDLMTNGEKDLDFPKLVKYLIDVHKWDIKINSEHQKFYDDLII